MSSNWVISRTGVLVCISKMVVDLGMFIHSIYLVRPSVMETRMLRIIEVTPGGKNTCPGFMEELTGAGTGATHEAVEGQMLRTKQIWDPTAAPPYLTSHQCALRGVP